MFRIAGATNVGNTKDINQDAYLVLRLATCLGEMAFAVLCDGMGGLDSGELASSTVVAAFRKWAVNDLGRVCVAGLSRNLIQQDWTRIVNDCNNRIRKFASKENTRLGTTATAILLTQRQYFIMNIGDSRAYEICDLARLITMDHTWENYMVNNGLLSFEEAHFDKRRNQLTRCIGPNPTVEPEFFFGRTNRAAVYMLCSDGFRHKVSEGEIWRMLRRTGNTDEEAIMKSLEELIRLNMERNERDNITALAIMCKSSIPNSGEVQWSF